MSFIIGKGYFGSPDVETTLAANEEVLQKYLPPVSYGGVASFKGAYKLSFKPLADCHFSINGKNAIFWEADIVFNTDYYDLPINSIKIVEAGINYTITGAFS